MKLANAASRQTRIILASGSPRRKQVLRELNIAFETRIARIKEEVDTEESAAVTARRLALRKADACRDQDALIIGMDTLVVIGKTVLGKPADREDAGRMLRLLSGKTHEVVTGVALLFRGRSATSAGVTRVSFHKLKKSEIEWYVRTGEPMDKAGAYGIQGLGRIFIEKIEGCYFNVMGFPVDRFCRMLPRVGLTIFDLMRK